MTLVYPVDSLPSTADLLACRSFAREFVIHPSMGNLRKVLVHTTLEKLCELDVVFCMC